MSIIYKHNKISFVQIKDILNSYKIPKWKDNICLEKIKLLDKQIIFKFEPITPIYFSYYNNNKYLIDGLHRLTIYNKYKNYNFLITQHIPIVENYSLCKNDMYNIYKLINNKFNDTR